MDWIIVTSGLVTLLTLFVTKTGESLAQKTGEEVFNIIKTKFKNDKEATATLSNFSKNPNRYKDVLVDILKENALADQKFGEKLLTLFEKNQEFMINRNRSTQNAIGDGIAQAIGTNASASVNLDKTEWTKKKRK